MQRTCTKCKIEKIYLNIQNVKKFMVLCVKNVLTNMLKNIGKKILKYIKCDIKISPRK
jgi:hypothetical protein